MLKLLSKLKDKKIIGIDGEPATGKSTLAMYIKNNLDVSVVSIDDFYLPIEKRNESAFIRGGNNIDYKRLIEEVISKHLKKKDLEYASYNCKTNMFDKIITQNYKPILIIEGTYSLRKELFDYYDFKILLKVDKSIQLSRLESKRNFEDFLKRWIPLSRNYIIDNQLESKVDEIIKSKTLPLR